MFLWRNIGQGGSMHEIYLPSLYRPQSTCTYCKSLLIYIFFFLFPSAFATGTPGSSASDLTTRVLWYLPEYILSKVCMYVCMYMCTVRYVCADNGWMFFNCRHHIVVLWSTTKLSAPGLSALTAVGHSSRTPIAGWGAKSTQPTH